MYQNSLKDTCFRKYKFKHVYDVIIQKSKKTLKKYNFLKLM